MKPSFLLILLILVTPTFGQITLDFANHYEDCFGYMNVNFAYTDVGNNPPYEAKLYIDNTAPFPDFLVDSAEYTTNTISGDFLECFTPAPLILVVTSSTGDSVSTTFFPTYFTMTVSVIDNSSYDGTVNVSVGGGQPPYTYHLYESGNYISTQSTPLFVGLPAGNYAAQVDDAYGCNEWNSYWVAGNGISACSQNLFASISNEGCFESCNGSLIWNLTQAHPDSSFTMIVEGPNNYSDSITVPAGITSDTISNLCQGQYKFYTYTDLICVDTAEFQISGPTAPLDITLVNFTTPTVGAANGSLNYSANGGTPPYLYSLNGGPYQSNGTFIDIDAGEQSLHVLDANGCSQYNTFILDDDASFSEKNIHSISIYPIPANNHISVSAKGVYTIQIMDLKSTVLFSGNFSDQTTIDLSNISSGTYIIRLTDATDIHLSRLIVE